MATTSETLVNDSDALYVAVGKAAVDNTGARSKLFTQDDLLTLSGVKDSSHLMPLVSYLTNTHLFRTQKFQGRLGWSIRPREAARQIRTLDRDEKVVYEIIEEAHTDGIWIKTIRNKSGIAQNLIAKAINKMEKANLVKNVKSVRGPGQKIYMLYHLVPSEDVTGNSFFDAGDLDESFRDELMNLIVFWVRQQSWAEAKRRVKREPTVSSPILIPDEGDEASHSGSPPSKKRKRAPTADIEDGPPAPAKRHSTTEVIQLAHPAGTHHYPTAANIHEYLLTSHAIKPTKAHSLTVQEIQECIDVLVWDDKLERVRTNQGDLEPGYRTVRGVTFKTREAMYGDLEQGRGTGLTQAPCGRCPVFDLCAEDGPINPAECVYFEEWLRA